MRRDEYARLDAISLGGLIASGSVSRREVLDAALEQTQAVNPELNAITNLLEDMGIAATEQMPRQSSLVSGVPFLLKDLYLDLLGTVTACGSRALKDSPPATANSTLTERYLKAGLVIFGKTNTPELGSTVTTEPVLFGPTRNPFNTEHSAGGSSGGAAAAVAAGIVPVAHASDGGGSIRIPASCCGLIGLKPTRARTPCGPHRGEGWNGQSVNHVVSRTVRDSAYLLDVTTGAEVGDPYAAPELTGTFLEACGRSPGALRIAFATTSMNDGSVHPEVAQTIQETAQLCEQLGHHVEEASPDVDTAACGRALLVIVYAELLAFLEQLRQRSGWAEFPGPEKLERATVIGVEHARQLTAQDVLQARSAMQNAGRVMGRFHQKYDIWLSPVLAELPAPLGWLDMNSEQTKVYHQRLAAYTPFTALFNQTGQPSVSVPMGMSKEGNLPIGAMFTAAFGNDSMLLSLAAQLEQAAPWGHRYPI